MTDTPPPTFVATHEHDLEDIPDPNKGGKMIGEVLPDDWTPDADR